MKRVMFLTIAVFTAFSISVFAQDQQQSGFHSVACVKVRDGKMGEFRQFLVETRKVGQAAADSGQMSVGYQFRSVMPAGAAATCDFVFVNVYAGAPPAPQPGGLAALLKKAGISTSVEEFNARRASLGQLVSNEMWRTAIAVGDMQKGDYAFINHMKVHDMPGWLELERSIWKPIAEAWVKAGSMRGWIVARPILPGGTGLKYQAITIDVMPNWDAVFTPPSLEKTFKQVHADKDYNQVMENIGKARDLDLRELMVIEDKIVPATKTSSGGSQ